MSSSYHHGDLKAALLAYAREQMEHAGFDGLSMREMAKAVGVSHTAAYRHFADKQALLDVVATDSFSELLELIRQGAASAPAEPRSRLHAGGMAYVRFGLGAPRRLAHMFSAMDAPQASASLRAAGFGLFAFLEGLVGAGQVAGVFRAGDTHQLSRACWAMVHGLATLPSLARLAHSGTELETGLRSAEEALAVFLDGLARM